MKQKKLFPVIVVVISLITLTLLSTYSFGGGLIRGARATEAIEAQLGIRLSEPISENMKIGSIVNGMIIVDDKLPKFGFRNVKRGDKVRLKLIGEDGKFEVIFGQQNRRFLMEDQGNIKLVK
jgi:hypothetical protein